MVSEDGKDIVPANVSRAVAGDLFSGAVEGYDVSLQVGRYQAASHALNNAVVEQPVIGEVSCRVGELSFAASNALRELAGQIPTQGSRPDLART